MMSNEGQIALPAELRAKRDNLERILRTVGRAAVAFSGGVDSSLLLKMAVDCLGGDSVLAVTVVSPVHPERERREAERLISVSWERKGRQTSYPVKVKVRAWDRGGLLRDIASVVADEDVSMSAANVTTHKPDNLATFTATLEITGIAQLSRLLAKIEQLPNVLEACRQVG